MTKHHERTKKGLAVTELTLGNALGAWRGTGLEPSRSKAPRDFKSETE
jgi:hypothetical protein